MSNSRVLDRDSSTDVVTLEVTIGGEEFSYGKRVKYISVTRELNRIPRAKIIFLDGDAAKENFELSESEALVPGKEVQIKASFNNNNESIFKGVIVGHSIKMRSEQPSTLILDCRDEAFKLTLGRKRKFFYESSDGDIMEEIISEYGLTATVDDTKTEHLTMVQSGATDWDFILSRSEVNGMVVNVTDGEIKIAKPNDEAKPDPNLVAGANILEFEGEIDMRPQMESVVAKSWDMANQSLLEAEGKDHPNKHGNLETSDLASSNGFEECNYFHTGNLKQEELQSWADAQLTKSRLAKVRGRVKLRGYDKILPDQTISLDGLGGRFNGTGYVSAVRHELSEGNWHTDVELGLDPDWFVEQQEVSEKPAAGLLPGIQGLQIGVVTQLQEDPDGEHRIRVTLPMIDSEGEGIWARIALLDAGENRGSFFYPEVGDEVVIGFLQGDPREGIILGMLNSSAKPAPVEGADDNHEKGFVTRSGMRVWFHDDDNSITIDTPNGNQMVMSEAEGSVLITDENANKVELTSDGISLDSPGDIQIKASGDVNIQGNNVEINAAKQMVAKGTAGAEFSSSGTNTIKGAMVEIN